MAQRNAMGDLLKGLLFVLVQTLSGFCINVEKERGGKLE